MNRLFILALAFLTYTFNASGQEMTHSIKLDFFKMIPPQIDGCSALYTYDSTSLNSKKYIVLTDFQKLLLSTWMENKSL